MVAIVTTVSTIAFNANGLIIAIKKKRLLE